MSTSIITNNSAILAVEILNSTASQLQSTQKKISTGYRVSDAVDDGAAFAVAQQVRSDIGALTTVNQQLGNTTGLLNTTLSSLTSISNTLSSARDVLLELANSQNQTGSTVSQYEAKYKSIIQNVTNYINDAVYQGKSLIGDIGTTNSKLFGNVSVVQDENGNTYAINGVGLQTANTSLVGLSVATTLQSSTVIRAALTATGTFGSVETQIGNLLNKYGSAVNYVSNQQSFNANKIDALTSGLGALVDANLTNESAQLQALQVRQQLATQSLSIANSAPQSLLKLFQ